MNTTTATEAMTGIAGWAVDVMNALGGPGAAILVGLDNIFPPIPSELILPLAGFAASQGTFSLLAALLWTTLGSVIGAVVMYYAGMLFGRDRTRVLLTKIPLIKASDFDRSEAWFARHGMKAVFFGRMVPLFRSMISLPAGIERMPMGRFLALTSLGSLIWNSIFVVSGYTLGQNWQLIQDYSGVLKKVVLGGIVVVTAAFIVTRLRNRTAAARRDKPNPAHPHEQ